jgi:hypothetical protein
MVGHHHNRTAPRNPCLIVGGDAQFHAHRGEQIFEMKSFRSSLHPAVEVSHPADRSEPSRQAGKSSDRRQHSGRRRIRVQLV